MRDMLSKAISFAYDKHEGVLDRAGVPYILHPLAVMSSVEPDLEAMIVAVLHDVIEDTDTTLLELAVEFGADVAEGVEAVSRREDETYRLFIRRAARHPVGRKVKIADIRHNMDLSRLPPEERAWGKRMIKERYEWALRILEHYFCTFSKTT
jgi:(p)ppGpp synthase/HD superfamily hydrolase